MKPRVAITYGRNSKLDPYLRALETAGLEVVRNPASLDDVDGLLVTGGTDVNPELYGEERRPETDEPDRERDELESRLIREAVSKDIPLLCICRGMQMFNVAHGGTLHQHLEDTTHQVRTPEDPARAVHDLSITPGTQLERASGPGPHPVNSRHHQAVRDVGAGLVVSARAEDGTVEGLENPRNRFAVAVQWHPEDRLPDPRDANLFEAFAEAVACTSRARRADERLTGRAREHP
ncbi:MAG: gamma-glutamyl-gamma-aminobutyrate hydrolase family protein [Acidobacteria bacterium]|nr:gamma-glutamyl-gamma-aminobutyrate hydrolase family protein [Acidobacteriota bacterium]